MRSLEYEKMKSLDIRITKGLFMTSDGIDFVLKDNGTLRDDKK